MADEFFMVQAYVRKEVQYSLGQAIVVIFENCFDSLFIKTIIKRMRVE
jgi:hypothetical protein